MSEGASLEKRILAAVAGKNYQPVKPRALARKLEMTGSNYEAFRLAIKKLIGQGRLEIAKNHSIRPLHPHGAVTGVFRRTGRGAGLVRPHPGDGQAPPEIHVREDKCLDAATGDQVLVKITRKPHKPGQLAQGQVLRVLERATRQFVGTYFERDGQGYVRVDGTVFSHSIWVGDPGAKEARSGHKVVLEMLRFPGPEDRGEGVITEVLGPGGKPEVETLAIIRSFDLPDKFPPDVLEEAREVSSSFDESALEGREDLTGWPIITIDPPDAHDFDDAISLRRDPRSKHWQLGVHIADVTHFVRAGGAMDREAAKRGNSVYLPRHVLPMLPEVISNGLASLQQGKVRFAKTALLDWTPTGQKASVRFVNSAIRVSRRFTYDEVSNILADGDKPQHGLESQLHQLLLHMREFGMILRTRRLRRGALELNMPEVELEYDARGRVTGGHFQRHDISHQIIEEFMLAANEAVAEHLAELGFPFLKRIHPPPEPRKLEAFAEFARTLGYKLERHVDRFSIQRLLEKSADRPDAGAVHYALLRSLKQAIYSPEDQEHYALASRTYCHFTSPIRRYPDLTVHRLLDRWLRTGRGGGNPVELAALGEHCSKTERRADAAERELVRIKLLAYLSEKLGEEMDAIITGVADYGFFAQAVTLPVEGLVHVSTLNDDYYWYDEDCHSLIGRRTRRRYRLGDRVRVIVCRVDLQRRQLDFRVTHEKGSRKHPREIHR